MHAATLISKALPKDWDPNLPCDPVPGVCAVTGEFGPCLPRKEVILDTNCDQPFFKAANSDLVSVDVFRAWTFGHRKEGAKRNTCPERQTCWWTDGREFLTVRKPEIRDIVLNGSSSVPWAMWVTTSYKKHGSIRAPVNAGMRGSIAFEERIADTSDIVRIWNWWDWLNVALRSGIFRSAIETLDCKPYMIAKIGAGVWMEFERWARPKHQSALYALLCYLLPSQEELKAESAEDGQ